MYEVTVKDTNTGEIKAQVFQGYALVGIFETTVNPHYELEINTVQRAMLCGMIKRVHQQIVEEALAWAKAHHISPVQIAALFLTYEKLGKNPKSLIETLAEEFDPKSPIPKEDGTIDVER